MDVKLTSFDYNSYNSSFTPDNKGNLNSGEKQLTKKQNNELLDETVLKEAPRIGTVHDVIRKKSNENDTRLRKNSFVANDVHRNSGKATSCMSSRSFLKFRFLLHFNCARFPHLL